MIYIDYILKYWWNKNCVELDCLSFLITIPIITALVLESENENGELPLAQAISEWDAVTEAQSGNGNVLGNGLMSYHIMSTMQL